MKGEQPEEKLHIKNSAKSMERKATNKKYVVTYTV